MMAKKGLGRGLDVFYNESIPEITANSDLAGDGSNIAQLKLIDIEPNTDQPRRDFDNEKIEELAQSIKEHGVITPILVTKSQNGFYKIIAGERRWRASKKAGIKTIPAIIKELDNQELYEIALIENLQRQDLNAVEEALGYKKLMDEFNLTQEQVAGKVSKSRSAVANSLRILNLDKEVVELIKNGKISLGHAKVLLGADAKQQYELAQKVIENELSVRELEKIIKTPAKKPIKKKSENINIKLAFEIIEKKMSDCLATKVKISNSNGKGKITIDYYSNEDLERITNLLSTKDKSNN